MKKLSLLMIGNSFSEDTVSYAYEIAYAVGIDDVNVCNMYIGGCSLDTHYYNAINDVPSYDFQQYENGEWIHNPGKTLKFGIEYANWDYISLQQASGVSGKPSSYSNLALLMDYVQNTATNKNVKLIWNMTWAYQKNSTHGDFPLYDNDQATMYNAIINAVKTQVLTKNCAAVIPNGTAIQNARTSFIGDNLTRDGFHLSLDAGRYIAGLTLVYTLNGIFPLDITFAPRQMSKECKKACQESAKNAILNAFSVTPSLSPDFFSASDKAPHPLKN